MKTSYKKFIDQKIELISKNSFILDIGGGEPFQKWLKPYKDLFKNCDYKTMDVDPLSGADIIGDIHRIPCKDESVDAVICHSVLEHIRDPHQACREIHRVLKKGGMAFIHVPSVYPYHARKGSYPDYWRFFDDSFEVLLKDFSHIEIKKRGGYFTALSFFVPFQHRIRFILDPLAATLDFIFATEKRTTTAGYYIFVLK